MSTIFRKDLRDAIRDTRILIALILPLGIGIFYNFSFDDGNETTKASVVYYSQDQTALPSSLSTVVSDSVNLQLFQAGSRQEVEEELRDKKADLGLIIPPGFDDAILGNERPKLEVLQPSTTTSGGAYVTAAIDSALRLMAGQTPPATLDFSVAADPTESETAIDKVGIRRWAVLASISMMIGMIAMLAIPVILAEETEKRTLDALILVSTHVEVVAAKALLGIFYVAVMVPLLLALTKFRPEKLPLFTVTVALLSVALLSLGLLMAGFFKSASQLNTWGGIFMLPVIAPAFFIGLPTPDPIRIGAQLFPTGAGTKLLMNSASDERVFSNNAAAFAIILVWGACGFLLLFWQLSRREA
jgi:ABC-2 type transport system permease protein